MADTTVLEGLRAEKARLEEAIREAQAATQDEETAITAGRRLAQLTDDYRATLSVIARLEEQAARPTAPKDTTPQPPRQRVLGGRLQEWRAIPPDPDRPGPPEYAWIDVGPTQQPKPGAPTVRQFPDGSERQWNPDTRTWDVIAQPPKPDPARPEAVTTPANQEFIVTRKPDGSLVQERNPNYKPPQTTPLQAAQARYYQLQADVEAGKLTEAEALRKWNIAKAELGVDKLRQEMEQAQREEERKVEQEQRRRFEVDRSYGVDVRKSALDVGQDVVRNYVSTMPYRVGPSFGQDFSKALQTLSSGGGQVNFSPDAFTYQIPDLDKMADEGARRALAAFGIQV